MDHALEEDGLLRLCIDGDEKAWGVFVERFSALVRWAIKTKVSKSRLSVDEDEINDIFQQVFCDIWRKNRLRAIQNPRSVSSWLVIVSQNAALNFARSRGKTLTPQTEQLITEDLHTQANPRTETGSNQLHKTVEELISVLPLRERRIMTLELFYDFKHREIAGVMSMPINTVSTIIARIKHELKGKLAERGYSV
ncbi:MAG: sigma-70 family RNA polymerase sigma factor [Candidatus Omnitrophica bacterium]|nr:sigma-70 family RNA polymerase sigma factor [Candidatus Omnitrophota bacterium]